MASKIKHWNSITLVLKDETTRRLYDESRLKKIWLPSIVIGFKTLGIALYINLASSFELIYEIQVTLYFCAGMCFICSCLGKKFPKLVYLIPFFL